MSEGERHNTRLPTSAFFKAINNDLSLTLTVHQVAETRSKIDCPIINDADAILQIMFFGRHISVNWTIMHGTL